MVHTRAHAMASLRNLSPHSGSALFKTELSASEDRYPFRRARVEITVRYYRILVQKQHTRSLSTNMGASCLNNAGFAQRLGSLSITREKASLGRKCHDSRFIYIRRCSGWLDVRPKIKPVTSSLEQIL
jgi:hypothetical protein